jgi:hypothetical protein
VIKIAEAEKKKVKFKDLNIGDFFLKEGTLMARVAVYTHLDKIERREVTRNVYILHTCSFELLQADTEVTPVDLTITYKIKEYIDA